MTRTANPALNANTFKSFVHVDAERVMTIDGTVNRAGFLLLLVVLAGSWTWRIFLEAGVGAVQPWMMGGLIGGLIFALVTSFKREWAPVTAPIYAILKGLLLGGLSAIYNAQFQGIVVQAVALTVGTLVCLLLAYKSNLISVTENFKLGVVAATGGIFLVYVATLVLGLFGVGIPYIHSNGIIGIGFSLFVVVVAALNLVLDFDFIEKGAEYGAPKYMEWYAAFGLMVTLIWLYIEILRLLSKLRSRN